MGQIWENCSTFTRMKSETRNDRHLSTAPLYPSWLPFSFSHRANRSPGCEAPAEACVTRMPPPRPRIAETAAAVLGHGTVCTRIATRAVVAGAKAPIHGRGEGASADGSCSEAGDVGVVVGGDATAWMLSPRPPALRRTYGSELTAALQHGLLVRCFVCPKRGAARLEAVGSRRRVWRRRLGARCGWPKRARYCATWVAPRPRIRRGGRRSTREPGVARCIAMVNVPAAARWCSLAVELVGRPAQLDNHAACHLYSGPRTAPPLFLSSAAIRRHRIPRPGSQPVAEITQATLEQLRIGSHLHAGR